MVSAVILAYNRCPEELITIDKLKQYKPSLPFPFEIVVVDNASIDNTTEQVIKLHPDVTLITKKKNNAIAGWNDGFAVAKHKYFLVLDDDSHIESGLAEAVEYLEKNSNVGILALNVTSGPYLSRGRWRDGQDTYTFYGCGGIIRKEVYEKIGGFSEWIEVYAHETDFSLRTLNAGFKMKYFENTDVKHRASMVGRSTKRLWTYITRNEMAIVYKYFPKDIRWTYIFRMFGNNLKPIKVGEFTRVYYCSIGAFKFLPFRRKLEHTPISREVALFYANNHRNTGPFFTFITKKIKAFTGRR